MDASKQETKVERTSDRELTVTRIFNGPVRIVYQAWTRADLFQRWWVPKSSGMTLLSCEMDVRVGGTYKLVFKHPASGEPMAFFGKYIEMVPNSRFSWTNEESGVAGAVTTVTFQEQGDKTLVILSDLYPSKQALDEAVTSGATSGFGEQFAQLDALLPTLSG